MTPRYCCHGNKLLDVELQKCVDNPTLLKTYQEETGETDPVFICPSGWESFTTVNISDDGAIVEPRFHQTLQISQYCVHSTAIYDKQNETVIAFCRPPALRIKKCCPANQSVNRSSIGECVTSNRSFNTSKIIQKGWPHEVIDNSSLSCKYDWNIYLPKRFVDNYFFVNPFGELVVPRAMYRVLRGSDNYCVDQAVDSEGNQEVLFVPNSIFSSLAMIYFIDLTI